MAAFVVCAITLLVVTIRPAAKYRSVPLQWLRLAELASLEPIDVHTHVFEANPDLVRMLERWHMHVLDIMYIDHATPILASAECERQAALQFARSSMGHVRLCTTFDPYRVNDPDFSKSTVDQLNRDFASGAVAVKIWKNVGMEIRNGSDQFLMPDDPIFESIHTDIAQHHKTLITHSAEPDAAWTGTGIYSAYYSENPQWNMFQKPAAPSKAAILRARDHVLVSHPDLRVIGAHFGSMEDHLEDVATHLNLYPNFAVDTAARMPSLMTQPRDKVRAFILHYQDRILYGTDLTFYQGSLGKNAGEDHRLSPTVWRNRYAAEWRYLATSDTFDYFGMRVTGLDLPRSVLKKIYHDNAVRWVWGVNAN
ncbi:MAG: amidohydrolase family protein [Acidobacteriaceae bacterium]|nr:amidohydrolase family protein [Acidobacteriaceae bacterium]